MQFLVTHLQQHSHRTANAFFPHFIVCGFFFVSSLFFPSPSLSFSIQSLERRGCGVGNDADAIVGRREAAATRARGGGRGAGAPAERHEPVGRRAAACSDATRRKETAVSSATQPIDSRSTLRPPQPAAHGEADRRPANGRAVVPASNGDHSHNVTGLRPAASRARREKQAEPAVVVLESR